MASDERHWMWSQTLELLARADRMHRQSFRPGAGPGEGAPRWEPPVDVFETPEEVLIIAALPGVAPAAVQAAVEEGALVISGRREPPPRVRGASVHRLELPYGQFSRRVPLPAGRYDRVAWEADQGCLTVVLRKAERA